MMNSTLEKLADERDEREKLRNGEACILPRKPRELDDFDNVQGGSLESSLPFRVSSMERKCEDLEKFSDELRLGQERRAEQIRTLHSDLARHDSELAEIRKTHATAIANLTATIDDVKKDLGNRLDALNESLNKRIGKLSDQFDKFQLSNKTWLIGILVSIVVSMIVVILSRTATIPGAHV